MDISVVIPVYGCPEALKPLHERLVSTLSQITDSYEIILVNDCCPKNSWEKILQLCEKDNKVIGINLSRNFGQIKAITAGLDLSKGDFVIVMDCDLQDKPEAIIELYNKCKDGYDVVFVRRKERKDSFLTKFFSKSFYKVYSFFTDSKYDDAICNYSIATRKVIDSYCSMREQYRDYPMFLMWLGFKQTTIDVIGEERYEGKSSYNFKKKLNLALEIITAQSNKPLLFSIKFGFLISFLSFIYIIYLVVRNHFVKDLLLGWTSIVASIFMMGGLILSSIGIVGIYVGNIFNETKKRPLYVISNYVNYRRE